MSLINIIVIIIVLLLIYIDFSKTKGFVKQKIIHLFFIFFLLYMGKDSMKGLFTLLLHSEIIFNGYYQQIGTLSPIASFFTNIVALFLGVSLFISTIGMITRQDFSRKALLIIIPFLIVINIPFTYDLYVKQSTPIEKNIFIIVSIILDLILVGFFFLYKSKFMLPFYNGKKSL